MGWVSDPMWSPGRVVLPRWLSEGVESCKSPRDPLEDKQTHIPYVDLIR